MIGIKKKNKLDFSSFIFCQKKNLVGDKFIWFIFFVTAIIDSKVEQLDFVLLETFVKEKV
jgi:hypothetical protein